MPKYISVSEPLQASRFNTERNGKLRKLLHKGMFAMPTWEQDHGSKVNGVELSTTLEVSLRSPNSITLRNQMPTSASWTLS